MPDVLTVRIQTGVFLRKTLHTLVASECEMRSHGAACALPTLNKQHVAAVAK